MKKISTYLSTFLLIAGLLLANKSHANFGANGIHDPSSIIKLNGVYHVFGTGDGIAHLTSTDLVNWKVASPVFAPGAWRHSGRGNCESSWIRHMCKGLFFWTEWISI